MQFKEIAGKWAEIDGINSRLEMTVILAELFKKAPAKETDKLVYLCQGSLGPSFQGLDVGMGENLVMDALAKVSGHSREDIEKEYKKLGDLGLVAEKITENKKQKSLFSSELTLEKVYKNFYKIATVEGHGSQENKLRLLAELLNSASPVEAKFITRFPIGNLRLGVGDPTIMDAFASIYVEELKKDAQLSEKVEAELKEKKDEKRAEEFERKMRLNLRERIEEKYNIHSDLGAVCKLMKEKGLGGLEEIKMTPGIPIRPTLAERLPSSKEIVEKLGKCLVEAKYDGFRFQCHKDKDKVEIFSRRSERMTDMFPEIVEGIREQIGAEQAIIEGEALAYNEKTGEFYPFQVTIQRKRKYDVDKKAKELPLKLFVFDVMMVDGKNLMEQAFKERRKVLGGLVKKGRVLELTKAIVTDKPEELEKFFEESIGNGLEGIIAKDLNAPYIAGARKFAWIKLKKSYKGELDDSVDVVIIGYYKGKGKRTDFGLGALLTAVYDEVEDSFKSVCKIGTGLSEGQLAEFEEMLSKIRSKKKPARVESGIEPDEWVEPHYVVEVRADEITKSPAHMAGKEKGGEGYALRFPRLISVRSDKAAEEATTVAEIIKLYGQQKNVEMEKK